MKLNEVLNNLDDVVKKYHNIPLIQKYELSECLRDLGCNLAYLVTLREEYYSEFKTREKNSKESSQAARTRDAEYQVKELEYIRKILKHYSEIQKDLRTQISLYKNELN